MLENRSERTQVHEEAIQEALIIAKNHPNAKGFLIIDLDDVRDDTRWLMWRKVHGWIGRTLPHLRDQRPSFDDVLEGGLRRSFRPIIGDENYEQIWRAVEERERHFQNVPLVDKDLPRILQDITDAGFVPILWLTARHVATTHVSRQEGVRQGLPDLPVFAMSSADEQTITMKQEVICELVKALAKPVIMIDDNAFLIQRLDHVDDPNVRGILYETPRFKDVGCQRRAVWGTMLGVLRGE